MEAAAETDVILIHTARDMQRAVLDIVRQYQRRFPMSVIVLRELEREIRSI